MTARWRILVVATTAILVIAGEEIARTCGFAPERAVFAHVPHPDFPLDQFAAGELGVLQPTYAASYLVVAYRYLSDRPLTSAEQRGSTALWHERLGISTAVTRAATGQPAADPLTQWIGLRASAGRLPPIQRLDLFRRVPASQFQHYENCLPDAFRAAVDTAARVERATGLPPAARDEWWRAQEAVFANCGGDARVEVPPTGIDALRADRAYQKAAAAFYRGEFEAAGAAFRQIAADRASPWRTYGRYLAARTLLRKATLSAGEGEFDRPVLEAAAAEFEAVTRDPELSTLHASAAGLRDFARARLSRDTRLAELASAISSGRAAADWQTALGDFTWLLARQPAAAVTHDDLTAWIDAFQTPDPSQIDRAIERWASARSLPWLVVALAAAPPGDPRIAALRTAAAAVPASSPAFPTVAYHSARLAESAGDVTAARREVDTVLAGIGARLPRSALNRFLGLRMRVSVTFDEWLTFALRVPTAGTVDIDGRELPEQDPQFSRVARAANQSLFDDDSTSVLNDHLPVSRLMEAAQHQALPAPLRRNLALSTWMRAWLLQDRASRIAIAPAFRALVPELASVAVPDEANELGTLVAVLRHPGAQPHVDSGLGREAALGRLDSYRDNWWCAPSPVTASAATPFLAAPERDAARAERAALVRIGAAPVYLATAAVRLARQRPADPRAPEALHLAVRATRYGCPDAGTGAASRAAFELLHRRYAGSEWAKRTPFWFK